MLPCTSVEAERKQLQAIFREQAARQLERASAKLLFVANRMRSEADTPVALRHDIDRAQQETGQCLGGARDWLVSEEKLV